MADKDTKKDDEHVIKPQTTTPAADTSDWPLLLKNYDKRTRQSTNVNPTERVLLILVQCL